MDLDLAPRVVQYHSDWRAGETALPGKNASLIQCRLRIVHIMGACVRPVQRPVRDKTIQAYPAGFLRTLRQHALDKAWVSYLVASHGCMFFAPVRLFCCFMLVLRGFEEKMQEADEVACARALQQHYFTSVPPASVRVQ